MTDHIETLREFNAWRRGAEIAMPSPAKAGLAIDALIAEAERLRDVKAVAKTYFDFVDLFIKNHLRDCPEYDAAALAFADLIEADANDRNL